MIQIGKLKNGIRIVNDYMPDVETVTIKILIKTGSRNENVSDNGISHFLEHMAFKGTKNRIAKQIAYDFESIGANFNAYTSKETTVYYSKNLKEYTEKALEILVDMIENSTFDSEELEKERGVILQELAMTNDTPDEIIFDYFSKTAFKNQSYGRSILGPAENIKKFTKTDFNNYINKNYTIENIVLSVAGNIKFEEIEKIANNYFNNEKNSNTNNGIEKAEFSSGFFKKEKDLEQVQCIIGFKGISFYDENKYILSVMNHIFGSGMSSRLFQEIRENKGLCYSICSFNDSTFDTGAFLIYTAVDPINTNKTIDAIAVEIKKMIEKVNNEELERAKTKLKSAILMSLESTINRSSSNGSDLLLYDKIITKEEIINKINNTTTSDIKNMLKNIISSSEPTIALYGKIKDTYEYESVKSKFVL